MIFAMMMISQFSASINQSCVCIHKKQLYSTKVSYDIKSTPLEYVQYKVVHFSYSEQILFIYYMSFRLVLGRSPIDHNELPTPSSI